MEQADPILCFLKFNSLLESRNVISLNGKAACGNYFCNWWGVKIPKGGWLHQPFISLNSKHAAPASGQPWQQPTHRYLFAVQSERGSGISSFFTSMARQGRWAHAMARRHPCLTLLVPEVEERHEIFLPLRERTHFLLEILLCLDSSL